MNRKNAVIAAELMRIKGKSPVLRPEAVVESAADPESVLHDLFDWDDSVAAQRWRVEQARGIIQRVWVTVTSPVMDVTRLFVSISGDRKDAGGYRDITSVMLSPKLKDDLLRTALRELLALKEKYRQLKKLQPVFRAIDKLKLD